MLSHSRRQFQCFDRARSQNIEVEAMRGYKESGQNLNRKGSKKMKINEKQR